MQPRTVTGACYKIVKVNNRSWEIDLMRQRKGWHNLLKKVLMDGGRREMLIKSSWEHDGVNETTLLSTVRLYNNWGREGLYGSLVLQDKRNSNISPTTSTVWARLCIVWKISTADFHNLKTLQRDGSATTHTHTHGSRMKASRRRNYKPSIFYRISRWMT